MSHEIELFFSRFVSITQPLIEKVLQNQKVAYHMQLLEHFDPTTYLHCLKVAHYAAVISLLDNGSCPSHLIIAALLHDVGKCQISKELLNKKEPLTLQERMEIEKHTFYSFQTLQKDGFPLEVCLAAGQHHERLNGAGYPDGLRAPSIVPYARIIAVADVFDAICSKRPYKEERSVREGLSLLQDKNSFDTRFVKALTNCYTNTLYFENYQEDFLYASRI